MFSWPVAFVVSVLKLLVWLLHIFAVAGQCCIFCFLSWLVGCLLSWLVASIGGEHSQNPNILKINKQWFQDAGIQFVGVDAMEHFVLEMGGETRAVGTFGLHGGRSCVPVFQTKRGTPDPRSERPLSGHWKKDVPNNANNSYSVKIGRYDVW